MFPDKCTTFEKESLLDCDENQSFNNQQNSSLERQPNDMMMVEMSKVELRLNRNNFTLEGHRNHQNHH